MSTNAVPGRAGPSRCSRFISRASARTRCSSGARAGPSARRRGRSGRPGRAGTDPRCPRPAGGERFANALLETVPAARRSARAARGWTKNDATSSAVRSCVSAYRSGLCGAGSRSEAIHHAASATATSVSGAPTRTHRALSAAPTVGATTRAAVATPSRPISTCSGSWRTKPSLKTTKRIQAIPTVVAGNDRALARSPRPTKATTTTAAARNTAVTVWLTRLPRFIACV